MCTRSYRGYWTPCPQKDSSALSCICGLSIPISERSSGSGLIAEILQAPSFVKILDSCGRPVQAHLMNNLYYNSIPMESLRQNALREKGIIRNHRRHRLLLLPRRFELPPFQCHLRLRPADDRDSYRKRTISHTDSRMQCEYRSFSQSQSSASSRRATVNPTHHIQYLYSPNSSPDLQTFCCFCSLKIYILKSKRAHVFWKTRRCPRLEPN